MRINEHFVSIQGEGLFAGEPTYFIRLQGCNLACRYCDTVKAQDIRGGGEHAVHGLVDRILEYPWAPNSAVCVTGGEPLMQMDTEKLVRRLWEESFTIHFETNGTIPPPAWHEKVDNWVVDVKCPCSGHAGESLFDKWKNIIERVQFKFVVESQEDLDYTLKCYEAAKYADFLISPIMFSERWPDDGNAPEWIVRTDGFVKMCVDFCIKHGFRFSPQLHKLLGVR